MLFRISASVALACTLSITAHGYADTVYTNASAYAAATAGSTATTINFNGIASPNSFVGEPSSFTLSGATFTAVGTPFVIDPGYYGFPYTGGGFLTVDYNTPTDSVTVTLPSSNELSFNYGGLFGAAGPFTVTLSDGFSETFSSAGSTASGSLDFLGIVTSSPITSVTFTLPDTPQYNALDNISYGTLAVATPEPSSLLFLATGAISLAETLRRRRLSRS